MLELWGVPCAAAAESLQLREEPEPQEGLKDQLQPRQTDVQTVSLMLPSFELSWEKSGVVTGWGGPPPPGPLSLSCRIFTSLGELRSLFFSWDCTYNKHEQHMDVSTHARMHVHIQYS